jgi:5-dehydro-2-deoxygluconokinase
MADKERSYDTLHMGRATIDFYSNDVGAPFVDISTFAAYVGGSPTNICVGAQRLGLKTAMLAVLGQDPIGDFVLNFLDKEGIDTRFIVRKAGYRTGATVLGIEPPDKFPMVYYRDNPADIQLTIDDVLAAPIQDSRVLQFAGTNLSRDPSRSATLFAAELARRSGTEVVLDLDFRADQWPDPRAFGVAIRSILPLVDIAMGTEDEINAAMLTDVRHMSLSHSQVSDARVQGDTPAAVQALLALGPKAFLQKRGPAGVRIHLTSAGGQARRIEAPGFAVDIYNILGAGDAFAAGFLYGYLRGWGWYKAARLGNACGAIVVTQHGCANFMPTFDEVSAFVEAQGGYGISQEDPC